MCECQSLNTRLGETAWCNVVEPELVTFGRKFSSIAISAVNENPVGTWDSKEQ